MNYRFLKSACAAALMASGGQAFAQVQDEASVQVSLAVDVSRSIDLELGGEALLNTEELINEDFNDPQYPPRSYNVRTSLVTGCLSMNGVNNITIAISGEVQAPGSTLGFLNASVGGEETYLHRYTALSIGVPGTNFATIFNDARNPILSPNDNSGRFTMGMDQRSYQQDLFSAPVSLGSADCTQDNPNIALGVMVGIDGGFTNTVRANRQYNSESDFLSDNQADGQYEFTDTVTVLITPKV
jgi:hypothetical protein